MKDKTTAGVLALLLGGVGAHKFYLGQTGAGIVYLLFCWTLIPGIIALVEGISLLTMNQMTFDMRFNQPMLPGGYPALVAPQPQPHNIVVNVAPPTGAAAPAGPDVVAQLKSLHELKLAGALTEEEFAAQKKKLLG
ncbi:MAG TPA: NINE protein [Kofleriaceae bacterium]|nr:NINE protein [Kofleriaceae bacterium]